MEDGRGKKSQELEGRECPERDRLDLEDKVREDVVLQEEGDFFSIFPTLGRRSPRS